MSMIHIIGRWQDSIRKIGETDWKLLHEEEWNSNQIQNNCSVLQAALCREEAGYYGIKYMAIGSGLVGWDTTPPSQAYSDTTLTTEYFRKSILQADILYIDPITNISTGGVPSSKLEISVQLGTSDANGDMREFALFGGTATGTLDSGQMINWVVHSKITKDSSFELLRKVRLEFITR